MKKPSKSKMPMHAMPGGTLMSGKSHEAGMAKMMAKKPPAKKSKGK